MTSTSQVVKGFKIAYPAFLEAAYTKQLTSLATSIQRLTLQHLNDQCFSSSLTAVSRRDDIVDDFENILKTINTAISLEVIKIIGTLSKRFNAVRKFVDHSFKQSLVHVVNCSLRTTGIPLNIITSPVIEIEVLKKMWIEKNTQLIKNIPELALNKINDAVYDAVRSGESMQSLSDKLAEVFACTKKRAELVARDQIAKLKSELSRHNDLAHGFTMYEWSSCKDGAVRDSHQVLEGKICSWLDASVYKNKANESWKKRRSIGGVLKHVGADIMCRCTNIILQEMEVIK